MTLYYIFFIVRKIPYGVWLHVAASWDAQKKTGTIFVNGVESDKQIVHDAKLKSYRARNSSHTHYWVGTHSERLADPGKTLYGFVKDLKVFKKALNGSELLTEVQATNISGTD